MWDFEEQGQQLSSLVFWTFQRWNTQRWRETWNEVRRFFYFFFLIHQGQTCVSACIFYWWKCCIHIHSSMQRKHLWESGCRKSCWALKHLSLSVYGNTHTGFDRACWNNVSREFQAYTMTLCSGGKQKPSIVCGVCAPSLIYLNVSFAWSISQSACLPAWWTPSYRLVQTALTWQSKHLAAKHKQQRG